MYCIRSHFQLSDTKLSLQLSIVQTEHALINS